VAIKCDEKFAITSAAQKYGQFMCVVFLLLNANKARARAGKKVKGAASTLCALTIRFLHSNLYDNGWGERERSGAGWQRRRMTIIQ
jgi:hypothetical protein